ncbi:hypothetical protein F4604DRAFT_1925546 [Suillus subluteus]|nr:hypothetical protein F4604DRAFT_1925546 [Suillus subluteus]
MTAWHQIKLSTFVSIGGFFLMGSEERISEKARKADAARAEVDALKTKLKTHADYDEVHKYRSFMNITNFFWNT